MHIFKEIFTTKGRLNRLLHLKYQLLWRLIYVIVEYILYFISSASTSPPEGIFLTMFPGMWSLVAGVLTVTTFATINFLTSSPMIDASQEMLINFTPNGWAIVTGLWAIVAGAGCIMLIIRRLHDLGKSGWFSILSVFPVVGIIFAFYVFCSAGQIVSNKYDADSSEN